MPQSTRQGNSSLTWAIILALIAIAGVIALTHQTPGSSPTTPKPGASDDASEAAVQVRWWRKAITHDQERRWLRVSYKVNDVARSVPSPLAPIDRETDPKWNRWTTPVIPYHRGDKLEVRIEVDAGNDADPSVEVQAMVLIHGKTVPCNLNGSVRHRGNNIAWCFYRG